MTHHASHQSPTQKQSLRRLTDFGIINGHRLRGDPEKFTLIVDEMQVVSCTPAEYQIAARLFRSLNTPVSFRQLRESVHLPGADRRAVIRLVSVLRQKIAPLGIYITNVKTYGYMITTTDEGEHAGISPSWQTSDKDGL